MLVILSLRHEWIKKHFNYVMFVFGIKNAAFFVIKKMICNVTKMAAKIKLKKNIRGEFFRPFGTKAYSLEF